VSGRGREEAAAPWEPFERMANDNNGAARGTGMHVEFTFHGTIREAAGRERLARDLALPDGATVGDALAAVLREVPDAESLVLNSKGRLRAHVALRHNGEDVRSGDGLETGIEDGDSLALEPSVKEAC